MTEQETQDKRLDKIRKILAKAERTNNPEEAKTFTAAAQKLMTEWAIDEAMVQAADTGAQIGEMTTAKLDIDYSPHQTAHKVLLMHVAQANNCEVFFTPTYDFNRRAKGGKYQRVSQATIFGFERDLEFTQMLFTSLLLQAEREFRTPEVQFRMTMETSHPGHRIKWRNSFNLGYAAAIKKRLWMANQETVHDAEVKTPGTALVLVSRKEQVVAEFKERYTDLHTKKMKAGGYAGGSDAGHAAGNRADIGQTGVGTANRGAVGR